MGLTKMIFKNAFVKVNFSCSFLKIGSCRAVGATQRQKAQGLVAPHILLSMLILLVFKSNSMYSTSSTLPHRD